MLTGQNAGSRFEQRDAAHQSALPCDRTRIIQHRHIDFLELTDADEIVEQSEGIGLRQLAVEQDGDVEVLRVTRGLHSAAECGHEYHSSVTTDRGYVVITRPQRIQRHSRVRHGRNARGSLTS